MSGFSPEEIGDALGIPAQPPGWPEVLQAFGGRRHGARTTTQIAELFGVVPRTVERWLKAWRGEPGQTRHMPEGNWPTLQREAMRLAIGRSMGRLGDPVKVTFYGVAIVYRRRRLVRFTSHMAKRDLKDALDPTMEGAFEEAAEQVSELVWEAYGAGMYDLLDEVVEVHAFKFE